jgi:hypothetical protein
MSDPMHLDVIGMPVAAVGVITGQHLGVLFGQNDRQALGCGLDVGLPETLRIVICWFANHARVAVAKKLQAGDSQLSGSAALLGLTALAQGLARVQEALVHLTTLTPGGNNEHDPMTRIGSHSHHTTSSDGFVVWVGVERNQRGH